MSASTPSTPGARAALEAAAADPAATLVALDFDGTLAPIVPRPDQAFAHPDAAGVLGQLADAGFRVAIITGRPVADVLGLGRGLADVPGLVIYGHYGLERWVDGEVTAPDEHPGIAGARTAVQRLVDSGPDGASVEDKGRSVAIHTRNADDPTGAFEQLRPAADEVAAEHGLEVVPGRYVLELRPPGTDKGGAMRAVVEATGVRTVVFAGDDLGDLPAVDVLGELPIRRVVICSDSTETPQALRDAADVVVDGPAGVLEVLRSLAR